MPIYLSFGKVMRVVISRILLKLLKVQQKVNIDLTVNDLSVSLRAFQNGPRLAAPRQVVSAMNSIGYTMLCIL
jgi:hypothetical protein